MTTAQPRRALRDLERGARRGEPGLRRVVRSPGANAYAVYRAAEDRADAAEEALMRAALLAA